MTNDEIIIGSEINTERLCNSRQRKRIFLKAIPNVEN